MSSTVGSPGPSTLQSRIGALLDPLADKVLLTAAYISLAVPHGQAVVIPLWLAILTLFRDFVIMLMAFVFYMFEGIKSFPPTWAGKLTTVMHVVTVSLVLLANVDADPDVDSSEPASTSRSSW